MTISDASQPAPAPKEPPLRRVRGQALVEFALVLPLLVVLLALTIDFGRVFFGWVSIHNAARVGAAYAAEHADAWESATSDAARQARYVTLVENDLQAINCTFAGVPDPDFQDLDGSGTYDTGEPVDVVLDCSFDLITPIGTAIVGTVDLSGSATFPVHYTIRTGLPPPPPPPPAPTCTVPNTVGQSRNAARDLWEDASFQPANLIETETGNFTVATQDRSPGDLLDCASGEMTISPGSAPPNPPCTLPTAQFSVNPNGAVDSGQLVRFTDESLTSTSCPITTWAWTFGPGSSSAQNPSHTFVHAGGSGSQKFTVTLTVSNAAGPAVATKEVTVKKP